MENNERTSIFCSAADMKISYGVFFVGRFLSLAVVILLILLYDTTTVLCSMNSAKRMRDDVQGGGAGAAMTQTLL